MDIRQRNAHDNLLLHVVVMGRSEGVVMRLVALSVYVDSPGEAFAAFTPALTVAIDDQGNVQMLLAAGADENEQKHLQEKNTRTTVQYFTRHYTAPEE